MDHVVEQLLHSVQIAEGRVVDVRHERPHVARERNPHRVFRCHRAGQSIQEQRDVLVNAGERRA